MNIFADFQDRIAAHLERIIAAGRLPADLDLNRFGVEPPRDPAHGDLTVNAAMVYAKEAKASFANPKQLATEIAVVLADDPDVASVEVAGPGFINIRLKPEVWGRVLRSALIEGTGFGMPARTPAAALRKVDIAYVLANLTAPLHAADCRAAVLTDALANLLQFAGYEATREIYAHDSCEASGEIMGSILKGLYSEALLKSDGGYTYFASDIAYMKARVDRGFCQLIDVMGANHGSYIKAAAAALSGERVAFDVKICQPVKLMRDGERSGDFLTLRDVIDEAGLDATRFMMLFGKNDAALDLDLAKVVDQSKDNAVFHVQYAYACGKSVLRQAVTVFSGSDFSIETLAGADYKLLEDEGELGLIKFIGQYPRAIEAAVAAHEPHRIAFYLHNLASLFHSHCARGKDQPQLRFVNEDRSNLTFARLALVTVLTSVLACGLNILGVSAPEEMR